ncbi:MAG: cation:proton antiporter [Candidatus Eremiobacterota bacterium]
MNVSLFDEMIIILTLSVISLCICFKLKIPGIIGFFITGAIAGPYSLGLVKSVHEVEILAETGVILLLFTIGIEFSIAHLVQFKKPALMGGSLQVIFTIIFTFLILKLFGYKTGDAIFAGFLVSLSSTAIVLKIIQGRGEMDSPYGRVSLAILIFQDIIIVPMMLFTPLLGGNSIATDTSIFLIIAKITGIIALVITGAKWIVPYLLYRVTRTRSKELFILTVVSICFGQAWITYSAGLSLALGAFLAGIIISESGYGHQTMASILPLKDLFMSFFFISIGMLINAGFIYNNFWIIIFITIVIIMLKCIIAGFCTALLGYPFRTVILAGLALSQIGEFSFILSKTGIKYGLLSDYAYQVFISVSVLTMALTTFVIILAKPLSHIALKVPVRMKTAFLSEEEGEEPEKKDKMENHVIIIGFGVNGRNLACACKLTGIPYVIIELNPDTVKKERAKGEPIFYGDAAYDTVLHHFNIEKARIVTIGINDPPSTLRITESLRRLNKSIYIIVRTRFVLDMDSLYKLGANEVIAEEFETSIEIFTSVLKKYFIPSDEIEEIISHARNDRYKMFRTTDTAGTIHDLAHIPAIEITALRLGKVDSITGKSLVEIDLRKKYEITLLAIQRDSQVIENPDGNTVLNENDLLVLLGTAEKIANFSNVTDMSTGM